VPSELVTLAGRYVLESRTAAGTMASVWRARDDVLARTVAVKILHQHLVEDGQFLERFRHEAVAAARLTHPNIVAIYDTGAEEIGSGERQHFIVMEHCGEGTLAELMSRRGPLDARRTLEFASDVCEALGYAHSSWVVHRDFKPANVLIAEDGTFKVADFGIAKAAFDSKDITSTGPILGSVAYLSPEQVQGLEPDARSDLYSLGVVMYELLAGRPPFVEDSQLSVAMKHAHAEPPPLRSLRAGIPRALEQVVMTALAKDPARRYASAEEMLAAIQRAGASGPDPDRARQPAAVPPPEQPRPAYQSQAATQTRSLLPVAAVIAVALVLGILLPRLLGEPSRSARLGSAGQAPAGDRPGSTQPRFRILEAEDFDPDGDGEEHSEDVPAAYDDNEATFWTTETYAGALGKPGVGLVFDLGGANAVTEVEIVSDTPDYEVQIRAGDRPPAGPESLEPVARGRAPSRFSFGAVEARYWLVWITELPGSGGGYAHIGEVEFRGT
jgi:eukaryotic-like serine/threonine-protein kinase